MKLGDFLTTLARKSNMDADKALIDLLSNSAIAQTEIGDSFASQLDNSLMSLDGAKNNPQVLNHFKPIILKAADDKFAILAEKYGFSDELTLEKSTYKKFDILESKLEAKIKDLETKQGKTANPEKEAEYQKQIGTLQSELQRLTEAKTTEVDSVKKSYESQITDMYVNNLLTGKKYATKDLPSDVNVQIARTLIESKLKKDGAVLVRQNGELRLKQAANPEMDFVDAGYKPVSFADFTDKTLAENKLLDVSTGTPPPAPTQQHFRPQFNAGNSNQNTSKFDAAMADALGE